MQTRATPIGLNITKISKEEAVMDLMDVIEGTWGIRGGGRENNADTTVWNNANVLMFEILQLKILATGL